jgi:hypothetical protein
MMVMVVVMMMIFISAASTKDRTCHTQALPRYQRRSFTRKDERSRWRRTRSASMILILLFYYSHYSSYMISSSLLFILRFNYSLSLVLPLLKHLLTTRGAGSQVTRSRPRPENLASGGAGPGSLALPTLLRVFLLFLHSSFATDTAPATGNYYSC